ncbi:unnamed protein product [Cuscuta campestris]|uniref:Uncharacterized protein n=1 Tax=Cuscuta campestris TaxID=132261 RepID=A0A484LA80_9ASTE|nr:unnamed protein product [Cuscuta campestris]
MALSSESVVGGHVSENELIFIESDDDGVDDSKETEIIYYHEEEDVIIIDGTKKTQLMLDDGKRYDILAMETSPGIYKPWDPKTDVMKFMQPTSDVNSSISEINSRAHLFQHGIDESYTCWIWHGELNPDDEPPHPHNKRVHDSFDDGTEENSEEDGEDRSFEYSDFMNHVQGDSEPLYPGCKTYTKLKALVKLYNLKAKHGISDSCFSEILLLLGTFLPKGNCLPSSFSEAKKTLCALVGLPKRFQGAQSRPLSGATMITPTNNDLHLAHLCFLENCDDVQPYFIEHMGALVKTYPQQGPNKDVPTFSGYKINGVTYSTKERDDMRQVQCSGVYVEAQTMLVVVHVDMLAVLVLLYIDVAVS